MNANEDATHPALRAARAPTSSDLPPYLTVRQVSDVTTLARSSIYNRMNDAMDPLPRPLRVGRRVMWSTAEVLRYMAERSRERDEASKRRRSQSDLT